MAEGRVDLLHTEPASRPERRASSATCRRAARTHTIDFRWYFRRSKGDCVGSRNIILVQCSGRDRVAGGGGLSASYRSSRIGGRPFPASDVLVSRSCIWALPGIHDPASDGTNPGASGATGQRKRGRAGPEQACTRNSSLVSRARDLQTDMAVPCRGDKAGRIARRPKHVAIESQ